MLPAEVAFMKIMNLNELEAHRDWFGVKSKVEVEILDPLPRDGPECPGGGMAMLYFTMEPGESFPEHLHPNSRIIIIWKGSGWARVAGSEYSLKELDCFTMQPRTAHTFRAGESGLSILSVHSSSIPPESEEFMDLV
jgi:quercetin dioxygenase-like cupin family protein